MDSNANQGPITAVDTKYISYVCKDRKYCRIQQRT